MSQDTLSIDVGSAADGNAQIFVLHGSLDVATSPAARAALIDAAERGHHEIIVDLSRVDFLDSTGLGALIGAQRRAKENGGQVRLVVADGQILRLLRITGLLSVLPVYDNVDSALAAEGPLAGL